MPSFVGAVKAGAHGLETDLHLTKDDVVVLSHVSHASPSLISLASTD
jgi:glycerophosphoryl diester phosphodiesterase